MDNRVVITRVEGLGGGGRGHRGDNGDRKIFLNYVMRKSTFYIH